MSKQKLNLKRTAAGKALANKSFDDAELQQIKANLKPLPKKLERKFNRTFGKVK